MKIETQMIQNSIFIFKMIDAQKWLTTSTQINFCCNRLLSRIETSFFEAGFAKI